MVARGTDYEGSEEAGRPIETRGAAFEFPARLPDQCLLAYGGDPVKNKSNDPAAIMIRSA